MKISLISYVTIIVLFFCACNKQEQVSPKTTPSQSPSSVYEFIGANFDGQHIFCSQGADSSYNEYFWGTNFQTDLIRDDKSPASKSSQIYLSGINLDSLKVPAVFKADQTIVG